MDKKTTSVVAPATFSSGESLTPNKLNAVVRNLAQAIRDLEALVGDPEDSSTNVPEKLSSETLNGAQAVISAAKDLNIVNLARLIGPAENLNPIHAPYNGATNASITEVVPTSGRVFKLKYQEITNVTLSDTTVFASEINPITQAAVTGAYWIDDEAGIIYSVDEMNGGTITYEVPETASWQFANPYGMTHNVMPDPNQTTKCNVTNESGSTYICWFPAIEAAQRNHDNSDVLLGNKDINFKYYRLPKVLTDALSDGDEIPLNFIKVKDLTNNEYITGVTYQYKDEYSFRITGKALDTNSDYQVITVGASVTEAIKDLMTKVDLMRNGRDPNFKVPLSAIYNDVDEDYANSSYSKIPQYFHRRGMTRGSSPHDHQTNNRNGIYGDLLLLAESAVPLEDWNFQNTFSDSTKIRFLHGDNGPFLYANLGSLGSGNAVEIDGKGWASWFRCKDMGIQSWKGIKFHEQTESPAIIIAKFEHTPQIGDTNFSIDISNLLKGNGTSMTYDDVISVLIGVKVGSSFVTSDWIIPTYTEAVVLPNTISLGFGNITGEYGDSGIALTDPVVGMTLVATITYLA